MAIPFPTGTLAAAIANALKRMCSPFYVMPTFLDTRISLRIFLPRLQQFSLGRSTRELNALQDSWKTSG